MLLKVQLLLLLGAMGWGLLYDMHELGGPLNVFL